MAGADVLTNLNQKIVASVTSIKWLNIIGWIVFAVILIGGAYWYFAIYYPNKKVYSKKITAFEIVGVYFEPAIREVAKVAKLGSGGFEVLYLKKLKTYKIAYGGRVGKSTYYFFILGDGYWYNGMLSANMMTIDKFGGLVPVVTTNPNMRGQYTSLEKQINSLHEHKESFMEKYGNIMFSIGFLLIAGIMLWLNYKQYVTATENLKGFADSLTKLATEMTRLVGNMQGASGIQPTG